MIQVNVPNFFYFAEILKMSELEPKNVAFSVISGNALKIYVWNINLDHFQQLLLMSFLSTMTFNF